MLLYWLEMFVLRSWRVNQQRDLLRNASGRISYVIGIVPLGTLLVESEADEEWMR